MNVHLRELTQANWEEAIDLRVAEAQRPFVAPNIYSIAESKFITNMQPFAIYAGETMVGFVMYGLDPDDNNYWIYRLMIDENHQRKGYARAAMTEVLERLQALPDCREIVLGYKPANTEAAKLYASLGFATNGEMLFGEVVARYKVK